MFLLVLALWVTHIVLFFVVFVSPLLTGRVVVSYVYPFSRLLDAYTWLVGVNLQLGLVALCRRVAPYLSRHLPPVSVVDVVRQSSVVVARCVVVAVPLLLVIPLLTGILMELLVFLPLRSLPVLALSPVQADVSASSGAFSVFHAAGRMFSSFLVLQDWAFGMVMLKAVGRLVMTAGDGEWLWRGRVRVERVRRDGWKRVDVAFFYSAIIGPILYQLVLHIAVPLVAVLLLWPLHALLPTAVQPETLLLPYSGVFLQQNHAAPSNVSLTAAAFLSEHFNASTPAGAATLLPAYLYRPEALARMARVETVEVTAEALSPLLSVLVLRYAFLLFACGRLLFVASSHAIGALRQWQTRSFEERWVVAKRLKNAERKAKAGAPAQPAPSNSEPVIRDADAAADNPLQHYRDGDVQPHQPEEEHKDGGTDGEQRIFEDRLALPPLRSAYTGRRHSAPGGLREWGERRELVKVE